VQKIELFPEGAGVLPALCLGNGARFPIQSDRHFQSDGHPIAYSAGAVEVGSFREAHTLPTTLAQIDVISYPNLDDMR
jgi:hypothetical protein